jgi:hypothetical protein
MANTEVIGNETLAFTLRRFAAGLDDMAPTHRAAARVALEAARSRAPVKTGQLRASGGVAASGGYGDVIFSAPYAGPIHWGWPARHIAANPFAARGVEQSMDQWLDVYADAIEDDLGKVKGA